MNKEDKLSILVIGQGYVGSAIGKAASDAGHKVIGYDTDSERVSSLKSKLTYEFAFKFPKEQNFDCVIIAVPTPLDFDRKPDLSLLESACLELSSNLTQSTLIVNESTSYPGTLRNLIAPLLGNRHLFATAPERVDPENKSWSVKNTPRLIAGLTPEASTKALELYRSFCEVVIEVSSAEIAEMAKLFENTFRQVNIALVNEFAQVCDAFGISASETLDAAETKPFGFMRFSPSLGVGGHCIPIDPLYLAHESERLGYGPKLIRQAEQINQDNFNFILNKIMREVNQIKGKSIQVAGLSYKPGVGDLRESKSMALINKFREFGAYVTWNDEFIKSWNGEISTPISKVDIGIILTAHPGVDYSLWKTEQTMVFDISPNSKILGFRKFL